MKKGNEWMLCVVTRSRQTALENPIVLLHHVGTMPGCMWQLTSSLPGLGLPLFTGAFSARAIFFFAGMLEAGARDALGARGRCPGSGPGSGPGARIRPGKCIFRARADRAGPGRGPPRALGPVPEDTSKTCPAGAWLGGPGRARAGETLRVNQTQYPRSADRSEQSESPLLHFSFLFTSMQMERSHVP